MQICYVHCPVTKSDSVHYLEQTSSLLFIFTRHTTKFSLPQHRAVLHTDICNDYQSFSTRPLANRSAGQTIWSNSCLRCLGLWDWCGCHVGIELRTLWICLIRCRAMRLLPYDSGLVPAALLIGKTRRNSSVVFTRKSIVKHATQWRSRSCYE